MGAIPSSSPSPKQGCPITICGGLFWGQQELFYELKCLTLFIHRSHHKNVRNVFFKPWTFFMLINCKLITLNVCLEKRIDSHGTMFKFRTLRVQRILTCLTVDKQFVVLSFTNQPTNQPFFHCFTVASLKTPFLIFFLHSGIS